MPIAWHGVAFGGQMTYACGGRFDQSHATSRVHCTDHVLNTPFLQYERVKLQELPVVIGQTKNAIPLASATLHMLLVEYAEADPPPLPDLVPRYLPR